MENLLRVSSYIIFNKLEEDDKKYMLVHGYTGAIDVVENDIVLLLKKGDVSGLKTLLNSEDLMQSLMKRGYLTQKTPEEEQMYVNRLASILHKKENMFQKSYVFVVTYDCNFRCPYCFEHSKTDNAFFSSRKVFTREYVDNAYFNIRKLEDENHVKSNKTITLYGGEPLLASNKEIVRYIVEKGNELGFKFCAITNGYDLEYYKDMLNENQIFHLQISIDGNKECHNTRRVHYQHENTFDKIIENIDMALKQNVRVIARVNTDRIVYEQLEILYQLFKQMHFFDYKGFAMQSALLRDHGNEAKEDMKFMSMNEYLGKHENTKYKYGSQFQHLYRNILNVLKGKERLHLRATYCNSQCNEYIFDPFGRIYPCWNCVGDSQNVIGNFNRFGMQLNGVNKIWREHDVRKGDKCKSCKYALLCGGSCLAKATVTDNGFTNLDCSDFPVIMKYAINRAYREYKAHIV